MNKMELSDIKNFWRGPIPSAVEAPQPDGRVTQNRFDRQKASVGAKFFSMLAWLLQHSKEFNTTFTVFLAHLTRVGLNPKLRIWGF